MSWACDSPSAATKEPSTERVETMHVEQLTPTRSLLLHAYYCGSWPARFWRNQVAARSGRAPVPILFYHRIADDHANSWTVSNRDFARHIAWLRRHVDLVSLHEAQRRISGPAPSSRRLAVSLTFDDGHADNCLQAIPLLVRLRVPCTYFVAVDHIVSGRPFAADGCAPNSVQQIHSMAASGIEIGAHTASHADLGSIRDPRALRHEIVDATRRLEDLIQRPVRYFAFPFGQYVNLSSAAFQVARDAGFDGVCSAYGGYNFPGDDPFHLQRIHADPGMIRLKNRVTVDRRMARTPRFCAAPFEPDGRGRP
ncbi:MAG: polysaccharide deacetylase family protein [Thermoguttaceae bacterium]